MSLGFGNYDQDTRHNGSASPAVIGPATPSARGEWAWHANCSGGGHVTPPGFTNIASINNQLWLQALQSTNPLLNSMNTGNSWITNTVLFGGPSYSLNASLLTVTINGSNLLTITTSPQFFIVGTQIYFSGLANATFLNGNAVTILSNTGTTITANFTHAPYGPAVEYSASGPNFSSQYSGSNQSSVSQAITLNGNMNIGDTLFVSGRANPHSGVGTSTVTGLTDSLGQMWNPLSSQTMTNPINGQNYTLFTWYTVATANLGTADSYTLLVNYNVSTNWETTIFGQSGVGSLLSTTSTSGSSNTMAPPSIALSGPAYVLCVTQGTLSTGGNAGSGFTWISGSSGFAQMDVFWGVQAGSSSAPSNSQSGSDPWLATQTAFSLGATVANHPYLQAAINGSMGTPPQSLTLPNPVLQGSTIFAGCLYADFNANFHTASVSDGHNVYMILDAGGVGPPAGEPDAFLNFYLTRNAATGSRTITITDSAFNAASGVVFFVLELPGSSFPVALHNRCITTFIGL